MLYHNKKEIHSEIVNYLLTEVVQSNKYYKSHTVGVMSEVGLITDRDLSVLIVLKKQCLLFLQDTGSHVVRATIRHKYIQIMLHPKSCNYRKKNEQELDEIKTLVCESVCERDVIDFTVNLNVLNI